ncbi:MAG: hypothetical protein FWC61_00080 [Proteobacteria bacterium]|nr:hypothetical protein [Pseudomonadota bacterium]
MTKLLKNIFNIKFIKVAALTLSLCHSVTLSSSSYAAAVVARPAPAPAANAARPRPAMITSGRMPSVMQAVPTAPAPAPTPAPETAPPPAPGITPLPAFIPVEDKSGQFANIFSDTSGSSDYSADDLAAKIRAQRAQFDAASNAAAGASATNAMANADSNSCDAALRQCMSAKCKNDFSDCALDTDMMWNGKMEECHRNAPCNGAEFMALSAEIKADRNANLTLASFNAAKNCGENYNACILAACGGMNAQYNKCLSKSGGDAAIAACAKQAAACREADSGLPARAMDMFASLRVIAERDVAAAESRLYEIRDLMQNECMRTGSSFDQRSLECVYTVNFAASSDGVLTPFASRKVAAGSEFMCTPEWFGIDISTFMENAYRYTATTTGASSAVLGAGLGMAAGAISSGAIGRAMDRQAADNAVKKQEKDMECINQGKVINTKGDCVCPDDKPRKVGDSCAPCEYAGEVSDGNGGCKCPDNAKGRDADTNACISCPPGAKGTPPKCDCSPLGKNYFYKQQPDNQCVSCGDKVLNKDKTGCECPPDRPADANGNCVQKTCDNGETPDPKTGQCVCPPENPGYNANNQCGTCPAGAKMLSKPGAPLDCDCSKLGAGYSYDRNGNGGQGACVAKICDEPTMTPTGKNGACECPKNTSQVNGTGPCISIAVQKEDDCKNRGKGEIWDGKKCVCPSGKGYNTSGICDVCPAGSRFAIKNGNLACDCGGKALYDAIKNMCVPCDGDQTVIKGVCGCADATKTIDEQTKNCVPKPCDPGTGKERNAQGKCVCTGNTPNEVNGVCQSCDVGGKGEVWNGKKCDCPPSLPERDDNNVCVGKGLGSKSIAAAEKKAEDDKKKQADAERKKAEDDAKKLADAQKKQEADAKKAAEAEAEKARKDAEANKCPDDAIGGTRAAGCDCGAKAIYIAKDNRCKPCEPGQIAINNQCVNSSQAQAPLPAAKLPTTPAPQVQTPPLQTEVPRPISAPSPQTPQPPLSAPPLPQQPQQTAQRPSPASQNRVNEDVKTGPASQKNYTSSDRVNINIGWDEFTNAILKQACGKVNGRIICRQETDTSNRSGWWIEINCADGKANNTQTAINNIYNMAKEYCTGIINLDGVTYLYVNNKISEGL